MRSWRAGLSRRGCLRAAGGPAVAAGPPSRRSRPAAACGGRGDGAVLLPGRPGRLHPGDPERTAQPPAELPELGQGGKEVGMVVPGPAASGPAPWGARGRQPANRRPVMTARHPAVAVHARSLLGRAGHPVPPPAKRDARGARARSRCPVPGAMSVTPVVRPPPPSRERFRPLRPSCGSETGVPWGETAGLGLAGTGGSGYRGPPPGAPQDAQSRPGEARPRPMAEDSHPLSHRPYRASRPARPGERGISHPHRIRKSHTHGV